MARAKSKATNPSQGAFNFDGEAPSLPASQYLIERDELMAQVRRDFWTLRNGPPYVPSKEFYEERLARFRQAVIELDKRVGK